MLSFISSSQSLLLLPFLCILGEQIGLPPAIPSFLFFASVSEPAFIPLSLNYPPGSAERLQPKAEGGTSLPVYIKDLGFKATGTAVRPLG